MPRDPNLSKTGLNSNVSVGKLQPFKANPNPTNVSANQYKLELKNYKNDLTIFKQSRQEASNYDPVLEQNYLSQTQFRCVKEVEAF